MHSVEKKKKKVIVNLQLSRSLYFNSTTVQCTEHSGPGFTLVLVFCLFLSLLVDIKSQWKIWDPFQCFVLCSAYIRFIGFQLLEAGKVFSFCALTQKGKKKTPSYHCFQSLEEQRKTLDCSLSFLVLFCDFASLHGMSESQSILYNGLLLFWSIFKNFIIIFFS